MKITTTCLRAAAIFALALCFFSVAEAGRAEGLDCLQCHAPGAGAPEVPLKDFKASVHAKLACADCHADIKAYPHPGKKPQVSCEKCHAGQAQSFSLSHHGQNWKIRPPEACLRCHGKPHAMRPTEDADSPVARVNLIKTCGACHPDVTAQFAKSVHGKALMSGVAEAPACGDCHGEHKFLGPNDEGSHVAAGRIPETCGRCHGSVELAAKFNISPGVVSSYGGGFHGVALRAGVMKAANCASCHGVHNILPPSDPDSTVNPRNLSRTCGACHPGAGQGVSNGKMHVNPRFGGTWLLGFIRAFYQWLILLTVGGMLGHNLLDRYFKWRRGLTHVPEEFLKAERMRLSERVQHLLMFSSFLALAYTGFAHTWPDQWWAAPFRGANGPLARAIFHRQAAALLVATALYHALYLVFAQRGRKLLKGIFPRFRDAKDLVQRVAYWAGRRKNPPPHRDFTYVEKAEYWAMVWGTVVMTLTGLPIVFRDATLRWCPVWVLDAFLTVHFWEAVLAVSAVMAWHVYWVAIDPNVFPMNWSWWTGRIKPPAARSRRKGRP